MQARGAFAALASLIFATGLVPVGAGLSTTAPLVSKPFFHRHRAGGDAYWPTPPAIVSKPFFHRHEAGGDAYSPTPPAIVSKPFFHRHRAGGGILKLFFPRQVPVAICVAGEENRGSSEHLGPKARRARGHRHRAARAGRGPEDRTEPKRQLLDRQADVPVYVPGLKPPRGQGLQFSRGDRAALVRVRFPEKRGSENLSRAETGTKAPRPEARRTFAPPRRSRRRIAKLAGTSLPSNKLLGYC